MRFVVCALFFFATLFSRAADQPNIIWPGAIKPGSVREDLVAFVDFAPTVLSLAGCAIPKELDGQVFLGPNRAADSKYIYAARDRMDEAYDRIRCVRDARF